MKLWLALANNYCTLLNLTNMLPTSHNILSIIRKCNLSHHLVYSTPERLIMKSRDNVKLQWIVIRTKLRKPSSATISFTHRHFTQRICRHLFIFALLLYFIKHLSAWTEPLEKEQRTRYLFFSNHTHRFIRCACNHPFVIVTRLIRLVSSLSNPSAGGAFKGW